MALTYNPKAGISGTTSGMQTVSQQKARMFADLDPRQLTPFQKSQLGGIEEIKKQKELARQLIESEKVSPDAKLTIKNQPVKETPKPVAKPEEPRSKANIWRVMFEGGDPSQDKFYDTEKEARDALDREQARRKAERDYMVQTIGEKETNKRLGKEKKNIGAIGGVYISGKTKEEETALKEQYKKNAAIGSVAAQPKSKEDVLRGKLQKMGATKEQQDKYFQTLNRLRSEREDREAASKARYDKFRSDIAAREASAGQLNQYNRQLSSLKKAYREAGRAGDYVEQYRIGDFINSYTAGVPEEMGARQKASQRGMIATKNRELEEMFRREREARIAAERTSKANPDYYQFSPQPTYRPTYYPEQFANNITFSNL